MNPIKHLRPLLTAIGLLTQRGAASRAANMAKISRIAILLAAAALFVVLVGVFFGVFLNNNNGGGGGGSTTPAPSSTTKPSPSTPMPTPRPTTTAPSTSPSPPPTPPRASVADCGDVEGEWLATPTGGWYAAFRGIPYAKPPLGDLRFKSAQPPAKWEGVLSAKTEGNTCFQSGNVGSEDCLYLNVYAPHRSSGAAPLPVYVFIHGGVFQYGSGGESSGLGPDFLVTRDVIVVTMNYRLGVLGYLSLDTDEVPGNLGLKDAVYALKWVKKNIAAFGGDPGAVTLGGQSSGGVSASWLSILPATKDLIRAAIVQSGTAVSSWGLNLKNIEFARAVYKNLAGVDSTDVDVIAKKVYEVTPKELYDAAQAATEQLQQAEQGLGTDITFFYLPTLELRPDGKEEKLITADPESYIIRGTNDIPIILGETKREWAQFLQTLAMYKDPAVLQKAIQNLITLVPNTIVPGDETQKLLGIEADVKKLLDNKEVDNYVKYAKNNYFLNTDTECNQNDLCKMAKYLDLVYIMADTDHLLNLRAKYAKSKTYAYVFNLKSDYNGDYSQFPDYLKNAVFHGNDMRYVWKGESSLQDFNGKGTASRALRRQVELLTNFIKAGNPTPEKNELITETWLPVTTGGKAQYLEITENLTMQQGSMSGTLGQFWADTFSYFRVNKSP